MADTITPDRAPIDHPGTTSVAHDSRPNRHGPHRRPWPAYLGFAWALSYLPIHLYWAAGGTTGWMGIHTNSAEFALANLAACLVLVGAGLTCLSLVQPWGALLPGVLRHAVAWVGAAFGIVHAVAFGGMALLRMGGVLDYPTGIAMTAAELRHYDLANVVYFEPWFAVMGGLLIATSLYARRHQLARQRATGVSAWLSAVLLFLGVAAVVAGTFEFRILLFAGIGPVLLIAGAAIMYGSSRRVRPHTDPASTERRQPTTVGYRR